MASVNERGFEGSYTEIEEKAWGTKEILNISDSGQLDFLIIQKGGYCSKHRHFQKYNLFYVITGTLKVTLFLKDGEREYIIGDDCPKRKLIVRPGTYHQFKALDEVECIEQSFVQYSVEDIQRIGEGGIE
jgi:mannose-6-phosphate isomerase-like protein (cupin superfamily)